MCVHPSYVMLCAEKQRDRGLMEVGPNFKNGILKVRRPEADPGRMGGSQKPGMKPGGKPGRKPGGKSGRKSGGKPGRK